MTTPDVSLIVVNYNAGPELARSIRSVVTDLADRVWEGVVVDNASSDDSPDSIAGFAPRVRLIRNAHNVGFARGVNQGLAATTAPRVLILNPDCRLAPGTFAALAQELDRSPAHAIVGPRILNPDGSAQGSARGDPDMLTGVFGRTGLLRRVLPGLAVSRRNVVDGVGLEAEAVTVDWLSGACVLARRDVLQQVDGFDERYFLYWEDADLCRRVRARGYVIRYVPSAVATHEVGHSSRGRRSAAIRAFHESAYLYYATHVAPHSPVKRLLARVLLAARRQVRTALSVRR